LNDLYNEDKFQMVLVYGRMMGQFESWEQAFTFIANPVFQKH
jgi:hypothetical protein